VFKHHAMKTCEGMEVKLRAFLSSAVDGGEWSVSRSGCFSPGEVLPAPVRSEDCMEPRAGLDAVKERTFPATARV
jgi:hypothetical protein